MKSNPRVALFTDSFLEVNGVAHTSRQLAAIAQRRGRPFLAAFAGPQNSFDEDQGLKRLSLRRTRVGFKLDIDLRFDLLFYRHLKTAIDVVLQHKTDVIHITGPGDLGQLGALVAYRLKLPLVISWHTNVHEFAARRLEKSLSFLPERNRRALAALTERLTLGLALKFHRMGRAALAPNPELRRMLEDHSKTRVFPMTRGVDTDLFSPLKRLRCDRQLRLGYVGRLVPEKNVRALAEIERRLIKAGYNDFHFVVTGDGSERGWLEKNLSQAQFTGVLKGEALAQTYADLDLLVFPSKTDTFGNVVLEALASGTPAIVSDAGGPKHIVEDGVTGLVASSAADFAQAILTLADQPERRLEMGKAARRFANQASWDVVFDQVAEAYSASLSQPRTTRSTLTSVTAGTAAPNVSQ
jgi:phosphatidylinositol alpha 1,6-mannosyltransferase